MTPTQRDIYNVIESFWAEYGYGPSIDEIMLLTGRAGRGNIQRIINRLVELGHCKKIPNLARTIRPKHVRIRDGL